MRNKITEFEKICHNISWKLNNQLNAVNYEMDLLTSIHKKEHVLIKLTQCLRLSSSWEKASRKRVSKMEL